MKATKIIIHTEPTKAQMNPDLMIDTGLIKGKIPLFLRVELAKVLMDYRDWEQGSHGGRFAKYNKFKQSA